MGIAATSIRYFYLNSMRMDLEYKIMMITAAKSSLMNSSEDLQALGADLSDDSPTSKRLKARQQRLHLMEKKLEMQMQKMQMRLQMINREIESCRALLEKNIERSCSYGR